MKSDAEVFVGLRNIVDIRKELLNSSKSAVELLKGYEELKLLRTQKLQNIIQLYKLLTQISALNKQFRNSLPKVILQKFPAEIHEPVFEESSVEISKFKKSKLEVLEDELAAIES